MSTLKADFIALAVHYKALRFSEFMLKSGRNSPYFFNSGVFQDGVALQALGNFYADMLLDIALEVDILFGPAYKGIPLVTSTAVALYNKQQINLPIAYNRKEIKQHGEGGQMVGADVANQRVLLIDDVLTAGTALRHAHQLIQQAGGHVVGAMMALDREERGQGPQSTVTELANELDVPLFSLIQFRDIIHYVQNDPSLQHHLPAMLHYQQSYAALG